MEEIKKLFNLEMWREPSDLKLHIRILFWKWEVGRFKLNYEQPPKGLGRETYPTIERLSGRV